MKDKENYKLKNYIYYRAAISSADVVILITAIAMLLCYVLGVDVNYKLGFIIIASSVLAGITYLLRGIKYE